MKSESGMYVTDYNVVLKETEVQNQSSGGIILSGDVSTGNKPGIVVAVGPDVSNLVPGLKVYLDWKEAMPFEYKGVKMAVVDQGAIKVICDE
tara:strand:- start:12749 stop:13024 length:276 start_codon:yes stop_codon:yes gene_type:complete